MGKRFKLLRLSRVIQSCRSKDPSDLPITPLPSSSSYFSVSPPPPPIDHPKFIHEFPVPQQPTSRSHHSSIKRHVSSSIGGCGCVPKSGADDITESNEFRWKKEEKWHVVARVLKEEEGGEETPRRKIYNSSVSGVSDGDMFPPLPEKKKKKKQRNTKKKSSSKPRVRLSISSFDSGWFSSEGGEEEEEEETETLVSSRTFSTDSSSDSRHLETIRESPIKEKKKKNPKRCYGSKTVTCPSPESYSPARLSVMMPCRVEGKVKESFAVVQKSEDPYEDFRRSMLDMILEKQMFEASDLEQLLNCFLSLNSRHHHRIIVEAFSEIWDFLFRKSPMPPPQPQLASVSVS